MISIASYSTVAWSLFALTQAAALPQTPASSSAALPQATVIHQFPAKTWIENLAIRSNGGILADLLSSPEVVYLDPSDNFQSARTVATFPAPATGVLGIAEMQPDVFYVATDSFNFSTLSPAANGTGSVWRLDMSIYDACDDKSDAVTLIAPFPQSGLLNGMAALPDKDILLIADDVVGVVWRLDVQTRAIDVAINNTFTQVNQTAAAAGVPLAANGVHIKDGYLYLTNSGSAELARVPIDDRGSAIGAGQVVSQGGALALPDDFALGEGDDAYITDGKLNAITFVDGHGHSQPIAAVQGPTSAQFGRTANDSKTLYIGSTGGDFAYQQPPVTVGGSISKIEVA